MFPQSVTVRLCAEGAQAEADRRPSVAIHLYTQAWEAAQSDVDACIAAHYMARCQAESRSRLYWCSEALRLAEGLPDEIRNVLLPPLHVNAAAAYEDTGDSAAAQWHYEQASAMGLKHDAGGGTRRSRLRTPKP